MHHQPVTQPLRDKLREAGFAPPEPVQKPRISRHKNNAQNNSPCKETPMSEETQTQTQAPETNNQPQTDAQPNVPAISDPIMAQVDKVTTALAGRIAGQKPHEVNWHSVAEFGVKTAIVVGGVAATTAAVVFITKAVNGSTPDPELPSPITTS
jgi:hypothetical protein